MDERTSLVFERDGEFGGFVLGGESLNGGEVNGGLAVVKAWFDALAFGLVVCEGPQGA